MKILLALLMLTSVAFAKDFSVNDQDQQAIQSICDVAATSPALPRDNRAGVASWCVQWEHRIQAANRPEPPKPSAAEPPAKKIEHGPKPQPKPELKPADPDK